MITGTGPDCPTAFRKPDDTYVQVACQESNVGIFENLSNSIALTNFLAG